MPCPACGNTEPRTLIAPGFYECQARLSTTVPTGAHPSGVHGPTSVTRNRACGSRYHEGGAAGGSSATCACGTYSIGQCAECGSAVCGDHSQLVGGLRLCADCLAVAHERGEVARQAIHAAEVAERQQHLDAELARVLSPLELTSEESFDALLLNDRSSDQQVTYWGAKNLVAMSPSAFTQLAVDRMRRSNLEPITASDYGGGARSLVGKGIRAARSYRYWEFPRFDSLQLTTSGRWHQVLIVGERNAGHGMSVNVHKGSYVSDEDAFGTIRGVLQEIINDSEFRKTAL